MLGHRDSRVPTHQAFREHFLDDRTIQTAKRFATQGSSLMGASLGSRVETQASHGVAAGQRAQ